MTLPADFDVRAPIIGMLDLVAIDAPSGVARFMVGQPGQFRDRSGNVWYGSALISYTPLEYPRAGEAPAGELVLSYFQDPDQPDLIAQLRDSGDDLLDGRRVWYFVQPLRSHADLYAPTDAPVLRATRVCRGGAAFHFSGPAARRITVQVEGPLEFRRSPRPRAYTTTDHNALIGATGNPSLALMPTSGQQEEKLFG